MADTAFGLSWIGAATGRGGENFSGLVSNMAANALDEALRGDLCVRSNGTNGATYSNPPVPSTPTPCPDGTISLAASVDVFFTILITVVRDRDGEDGCVADNGGCSAASSHGGAHFVGLVSSANMAANAADFLRGPATSVAPEDTDGGASSLGGGSEDDALSVTLAILADRGLVVSPILAGRGLSSKIAASEFGFRDCGGAAVESMMSEYFE